MKTEEITQIIETIKTLNLNVDSETLVEIVNQLTPLFYFLLIKDFVLEIVSGLILLTCVWFISKSIMSYFQKKSEE